MKKTEKMETYEATTFKDRLMQAIKQIRAVERRLEDRIYEHPEEKKFLRQCQEELCDCQDTLAVLHKEVLEYIG